jgi:NDP-sugar pyrophosphorylase family protein
MTDPFLAKNFFNLDSFAHHSLFSEEDPVWDALKNIIPYLSKLELGKIEGTIEEGAYLVHPETISIGPGSIVEAGAYIRGPCVIGKNCEVRHGAYIRGQVIVGDRCVIGHATEVKHAIFLDDAHAGHFSYVGDSILGNRVNLGAGVKCANLRLDRKNVLLNHNGKKIDSQLRKWGAILGDDVQIGCNAVTNPGTLMGKKSLSYPCVSIKGFIPENGVVK